ncbi:RHS repeat domain-containing protein [Gilliamella sp. Bif1-4]|uniref:RHS repeat domain-containing protein n=1 Tax=Gilliamella sp. Bif1-4 TaxID=3120233 RepID=UPI00080DA91B|nr:hypothetical protein [Gilliamella apicola]OCG39805.1 hypothetical protein A9G25_10455 [Gilliamella apicola]
MTHKYSCITELSNHAQPLIDKRFDYDRAGNLIGQANSYGNYPNRVLNKSPRYSENYHYDPVQQITGLQTHYGQHHFAYDPAGNLLNDHSQAIQHNRLTHYNGYYYRYDFVKGPITYSKQKDVEFFIFIPYKDFDIFTEQMNYILDCIGQGIIFVFKKYKTDPIGVEEVMDKMKALIASDPEKYQKWTKVE